MTGDLSKSSWVFAHGSLMFDPDFGAAPVMSGRAWGWERRFGQPSVRNWGTADTPAPTTSLSRGSHCDGLLLGLPKGRSGSLLASLIRREANEPVTVTVSSEFGDVSAFTWLMSDAWASLGVEELADHAVANVRAGGGPRGDAWRYARGVRDALSAYGLDDPLVSEYVEALRPGVPQTESDQSPIAEHRPPST
jgi:cation transport regulator ChaC